MPSSKYEIYFLRVIKKNTQNLAQNSLLLKLIAGVLTREQMSIITTPFVFLAASAGTLTQWKHINWNPDGRIGVVIHLSRALGPGVEKQRHTTAEEDGIEVHLVLVNNCTEHIK